MMHIHIYHLLLTTEARETNLFKDKQKSGVLYPHPAVTHIQVTQLQGIKSVIVKNMHYH